MAELVLKLTKVNHHWPYSFGNDFSLMWKGETTNYHKPWPKPFSPNMSHIQADAYMPVQLLNCGHGLPV